MNTFDKSDAATLPMMAMKDVPEAKAGARRVTGLVKEGGRVIGYQLSDGQIVDKQVGVTLARQGEIAGVGISERNGNEYLKSLPDETENNNLNNLPSVSQ